MLDAYLAAVCALIIVLYIQARIHAYRIRKSRETWHDPTIRALKLKCRIRTDADQSGKITQFF